MFYFENVEQVEVVANYSRSFDPHHCLPCLNGIKVLFVINLEGC